MKQGEYHIVVHVCIFSPDGKMLVQQRQNFKGVWPNRWDFSTAGSAIAGETSRDAAVREVKEELGADISKELKYLRPHFTVNFEKGFDDFYIVTGDFPLSSLSLQAEEVQQARYAGFDEINEMIDKCEFIPYHKSLVSLIFDFHKYSCAYKSV